MFPGSYARAAGLQSELCRGSLTRVAGREIDCTRHLDICRKHLKSRMTSIKHQQDQLRKSVQEYSLKLKHNRREREVRLQSDLAFDRRCLRLALESERKVLSEFEEDHEDVKNLDIIQEKMPPPIDNTLSLFKRNEKFSMCNSYVDGSILQETNETNNLKLDSNTNVQLRRHSITAQNNMVRKCTEVLNSVNQNNQNKINRQQVNGPEHTISPKDSSIMVVHPRILGNNSTYKSEHNLERRSCKGNPITNKTDSNSRLITDRMDKKHALFNNKLKGRLFGHVNESRTKLDSRGGERTARFDDNKAERLPDIKSRMNSGHRVPGSVDVPDRQEVPDTRDNIFFRGPHGAQGVSHDLIRTAAITYPIRYGYNEQNADDNSKRKYSFDNKATNTARRYWQVLKENKLKKKRASSRSYALWKRVVKHTKSINEQKKSKWKSVDVSYVLQIPRREPKAGTQLVTVNEGRIRNRTGEIKSSSFNDVVKKR